MFYVPFILVQFKCIWWDSDCPDHVSIDFSLLRPRNRDLHFMSTTKVRKCRFPPISISNQILTRWPKSGRLRSTPYPVVQAQFASFQRSKVAPFLIRTWSGCNKNHIFIKVSSRTRIYSDRSFPRNVCEKYPAKLLKVEFNIVLTEII